MNQYYKIPLLFLTIASCIGLLLRYHFIQPFQWLIFPYWLHAHSHLMFLGWVMNVLYIAFVNHYVSDASKRYIHLFIFLQLTLMGMMIAFPMQGYGLYSITFSTLHTVGIALFTYWIHQDTKHQTVTLSIWLMRKSLLFFLISALGPFTLGPLMANGLGHTPWYYSAIYFYLHFQYNGVFIFGCLSLLFHFFEQRGLSFNHETGIKSLKLLVVGTIVTYTLSVLWTSPGLWVNVIGGVGAVIQLVSFYYLWETIKPLIPQLKKDTPFTPLYFLYCAWLAFAVKLLLQLLSAWPTIAQLAYTNRSYIIAYLHFVLIGVVTFFLIGWLFITHRLGFTKTMLIFICTTLTTGFVGLEVVLIFGMHSFNLMHYSLFISSVLLTIGFAALLFNKNKISS